MTGTAPLTPEILVSRLGDYLVDRGLISSDQLSQALIHQRGLRSTGQFSPLLGQILIEMGFIDKTTLDSAITEQILQLRSALQEANRNLLLANQDLERRVEERTAELQEALRKLAELNNLKSNFVANISHELRTPMTHLKGYLELLAGEDLGPIIEEQAQALAVMQRASSRLERLIEDLLLFSMAERNQITISPLPIDLKQICSAAIRENEIKAADHKVQLIQSLPRSLPNVQADPEKLSWVIEHLIDNAIKFTPEGGKVVLRVDPPVLSSNSSKNVRVSILDTGIGIPGDKLEEIFEPFHQLDSSSTRRYGGTGLGLALVRKIIEAHGSQISVISQVGHGSEFEFYLNLVSP